VSTIGKRSKTGPIPTRSRSSVDETQNLDRHLVARIPRLATRSVWNKQQLATCLATRPQDTKPKNTVSSHAVRGEPTPSARRVCRDRAVVTRKSAAPRYRRSPNSPTNSRKFLLIGVRLVFVRRKPFRPFAPAATAEFDRIRHQISLPSAKAVERISMSIVLCDRPNPPPDFDHFAPARRINRCARS